MSKEDHSKYLESEYERISNLPGFPHARVNPSLVGGDVGSVLASPEERLLFVMHAHGAELLVVSNRRIVIYHLPDLKPLSRRSGVAVVRIAVAFFVEPVHAVMEVSEKVWALFNGVRRLKRWMWPKDRREAARRKAEGQVRGGLGPSQGRDTGADRRLPRANPAREQLWMETRVRDLA
jgi:hypothetical protein